MASTYSTGLRLELMATGEKSGTWGSVVNTTLQLVEAAVSGRAAVTHSDAASYTLTANNGSSDEARQMILNIAGALTAARNTVCPTSSKLYVAKNATTGGYATTLKTSGGTGISIPNGNTTLLFCDGTNVVNAIDYLSSLTVGGALTSGGTLTASGILQVVGNTTLSGDLTFNGVSKVTKAQDGSGLAPSYSFASNLGTGMWTAATVLGFSNNATERGRNGSSGHWKFSDDGTYNAASGAYHELRTSGSANIAYLSSTHVSDPAGVAIVYTAVAPNDAGHWFLECQDSAATRFRIAANGGSYGYTANDVNLCDARTKDVHGPLGSQRERFRQLVIYEGRYLDAPDDAAAIPFWTAQQVERVYPEYVPAWNERFKGVKEQAMSMVAFKTIQEIDGSVLDLERRLAALECRA